MEGLSGGSRIEQMALRKTAVLIILIKDASVVVCCCKSVKFTLEEQSSKTLTQNTLRVSDLVKSQNTFVHWL